MARRGELDALRVAVVLGLILFHAALVFDANDDFYVKNDRTTEATVVLAGLGVVWAMPTLFAVAGIGAWHSLRRRGPGPFTVERLLRLGVPLLVAMVTIVPVPQWLRLRSDDPGYDQSYTQFLRAYFDVHLDLGNVPFAVRGEHFETGHLWFVVLLLTFSFLWPGPSLRSGGRAVRRRAPVRPVARRAAGGRLAVSRRSPPARRRAGCILCVRRSRGRFRRLEPVGVPALLPRGSHSPRTTVCGPRPAATRTGRRSLGCPVPRLLARLSARR
ncbi:acyltransferase family protein [Oerskovia sp. M15]